MHSNRAVTKPMNPWSGGEVEDEEKVISAWYCGVGGKVAGSKCCCTCFGDGVGVDDDKGGGTGDGVSMGGGGTSGCGYVR